MQRTLSIIKPDAVKKNVVGKIIDRFESNGLRVAAAKKTNPKEAAPGTIRADFADSIDANAVHGSDSLENAVNEINFFFASREIC